MNPTRPEDVETDDRFPSGPWIGFFTDKRLPGKHDMELSLSFGKGVVQGEGRDRVGDFILRGQYSVEDGKAHWTKKYLKAHDVFYSGYAETKGIWGTWELTDLGETYKGGFHIWPKGMNDPTKPTISEEAEVTHELPDWSMDDELIPAGGIGLAEPGEDVGGDEWKRR